MHLLALILAIASANIEDLPPSCESPRAAISSLLDNLQHNNWAPQKAASCFETQEDEHGSNSTQRVAIHLKQLLDARGIFIRYEELSSNADHKNERDEHISPVSEYLDGVYLERQDVRWIFPKSSQQEISRQYTDTFSAFVLKFLNDAPPFFFKSFIGLQVWQLLYFLLQLLCAFLAGLVFDKLVFRFLLRRAKVKDLKLNKNLFGMEFPAVLLVSSIVIKLGITDLQLPIHSSLALHFITDFTLSFSVVWLCSRLIRIGSLIFSHQATTTVSKLDDQLVPLLTKTAQLLVWAIGIVFILQNMGVQVTALLAGASVGGVAIALASKDTIENLFGSIVVFIDQPFQIGDWVLIDGTTEGVVEEVGFRSTRIRTFANSLITVPNSKIAHSTVNNFGKRERRRFKTMLSLRYDTPLDKLEAYLEAVRDYLRGNEKIFQDVIFVYLNNMGPHSVDILVYTFFVVENWSEELSEKEQCYLQFLRIAEQQGVSFAFPTQTLELELNQGQSIRDLS